MANRTVSYKIQADISNFTAKMSQASAATKKVADDMTKVYDRSTKAGREAADAMDKQRQGVETFGTAFGRSAVVAGAGAALVTKAAMDWETAFAGVEKTVDGSTAQLGMLEEQLREMARTMPATHEEIAAVAQAAGALGVATPDIANFTKTMIMLSTAADDLTADQAATAVAQLANVAQTAPEDIDNLAASLVALGNNGASTEGQILFMAQSIASSASQLGIAEADILAIANATASMGIEVEAGGTAISTVLSKMASAAKMGGADLDAFASTAGMTADEFSRLVESDPTQAFVSLTQGLNRVNESGGNVFAVLKDLGLSDVRVSRAMLSIASAGDTLTKSLDTGRTAWDENTALIEEFAKKAGTTASEVQTSFNNIKDAAIDAGAAMLPVVEAVASGVSGLANAFQALPAPLRAAAGPLLALSAVLGGSVWAGTRVIQGVANTREALHNLGVTAGSTRSAMGRVAGFFGGPWSIAIGLGVTALGGWVASQQTASEAARELSATLDEQTGSLTQNSREWASAQLLDSGALAAAKELGISLTDVTDAALGNRDALERVRDAVWEARDAWKGGPANDVMRSVTEIGAIVSDGTAEWQLMAEAQGDSAKASEDVAGVTKSATGATQGLAAATADSSATSEQAAAAYAKQAQASAGVARQFTNITDGLNDSELSLVDWIRKMRQSADALRNFRLNAEQAGRRGLRAGLIKELQAAGPEGAMRMKQLANATQAEIGRANRAWAAGRREVNRYVDSTTQVPGQVATDVDLEVRQAEAKQRELRATLTELGKMRPTPEVQARTARAEAALARLQARLDLLRDKQIYVTTITREVGAVGATGVGAQTVRRRAFGGPVWGPGTPTSDSIPALLSNGEFVQRAAAHSYYGTAAMDALNNLRIPRESLQAFAFGGAVSARSGAASVSASAAPRVNVAAPNVSVGGARLQVFLDGHEIEAVVRRVNEAERQFQAGARIGR
ncbi:hypothetical protein GCM10027425_12360 [Alteromonas gracilis]